MNNEELSLLLGMSDQLQAAVYNGTFKQVERNTKQYKQGFFSCVVKQQSGPIKCQNRDLFIVIKCSNKEKNM